MSAQLCPRCGAALRTKQVSNLLAKYCDRCGSLPHATNVKTGKVVLVDRAGTPIPPVASQAVNGGRG